MNIVIVGGGKQVDFLVLSLLKKNKNHNITIINGDEHYCKEIARNFSVQGYDVQVVFGEGSKPFILDDAGIRDADLIISLTSKDADNLIICQLAKRMFSVKRAFATVSNPENVGVFKKLGINTAVSSTLSMANIIEQMAQVDEVAHYLPLEDGKALLLTLTISQKHAAYGKKITELDLSTSGATLGCVMRADKVIIPALLNPVISDENIDIEQPEAAENNAIVGSESAEENLENAEKSSNNKPDSITDAEITEIENSYNNIGDIDINTNIDNEDATAKIKQNADSDCIQEGDKLIIITTLDAKKQILEILLGDE